MKSTHSLGQHLMHTFTILPSVNRMVLLRSSVHSSTPEDACTQPDFCCTLESRADGTMNARLKRSHNYFAQVQGQMAITGRHWCHFVLYTKIGLSVEMILFDENFWNTELLPALEAFYTNCVAPEIVCPVHFVGLPLRDLRHVN